MTAKLIWALLLCLCSSQNINFTQLYHEATQFYLDEQWADTIDSFQRLLREWKSVQEKLSLCMRDCESSQSEHSGHKRLIAIASCHLQCKPLIICDRPTKQKLVNNDPFNYLQLAFYRLNDLEKAALCAYLYFSKNNEDSIAQSNLKYFQNMPGIQASYFTDDKLPTHLKTFTSLPEEYSRETANPANLLTLLKTGLADYAEEHKSCSFNCQKPLNFEEEFDVDDGDLASNLGIHFSQYVNCSMFCDDTIANSHEGAPANYLLSYLFYLYSLSKEVGDDTVTQAVLASLSKLDLSKEALSQIDPEINFPDFIDSKPLSQLETYFQRRIDIQSISGLLNDFLNS